MSDDGKNIDDLQIFDEVIPFYVSKNQMSDINEVHQDRAIEQMDQGPNLISNVRVLSPTNLRERDIGKLGKNEWRISDRS